MERIVTDSTITSTHCRVMRQMGLVCCSTREWNSQERASVVRVSPVGENGGEPIGSVTNPSLHPSLRWKPRKPTQRRCATRATAAPDNALCGNPASLEGCHCQRRLDHV